MAATAIYLRFRPHRHLQLQFQCTTSSFHFYSSSSSNSDDNNQNKSRSQSYFADVKASLKQTTSSSQQPHRPSFLNSNPNAQNPASLDEIRKNLSEYRRQSTVQPPNSSPPVLSFQELYKQNAMPKPDPGSESEVKRDPAPFDSIRMSLKNLRMNSPKSTEDARQRSPFDKTGFNLNLNLNLRPTSENAVPGSNMKNNNKRSSVSSNETKPDFMRSYGYLDLGSKLKKLKPVTKNNEFSLSELNDRLKKVREMDDKEMQNTSGLKFSHLRESLAKLQTEEIQKKNAGKRSVLSELGTPHFMLSPPKEDLVEKYFHPDHMSSAEKQKIELKNVREKFKISESDCGSARVQVAQLTTKIKHLATVLHKKDKHSQKGLQGMVQKRKKLLKYLRRTDWDSYCFCLRELGLRDSVDYKI
ncbi:uncharacterized protein [Rutidosis leptorrhynchoides]|uniref:uncharacterized protein n=1 Tax=Rutidosis leptorrhynchoides TaxID=125765 RepID=UPI003A9A6051